MAAIASNVNILRLLQMLYSRRCFPFQTLNFPVGTQQPRHTDSVHFSSAPPLGGFVPKFPAASSCISIGSPAHLSRSQSRALTHVGAKATRWAPFSPPVSDRNSWSSQAAGAGSSDRFCHPCESNTTAHFLVYCVLPAASHEVSVADWGRACGMTNGLVFDLERIPLRRCLLGWRARPAARFTRLTTINFSRVPDGGRQGSGIGSYPSQ